MGEAIHREICKQQHFDDREQCYAQMFIMCPEERNSTFLWGFEFQTDHLTQAGKADLIVVKQEEKEHVRFGPWGRSENWCEKKKTKKKKKKKNSETLDKYFYLARDL